MYVAYHNQRVTVSLHYLPRFVRSTAGPVLASAGPMQDLGAGAIWTWTEVLLRHHAQSTAL